MQRACNRQPSRSRHSAPRWLYVLAIVVTLSAQWVMTPLVADAATLTPVDNDPENKLWNCETNRIGFNDPTIDKSRCFTFRYSVPAGGITSAFLHLSVKTAADQDTDALAIAVGVRNPDCEGGNFNGKMTGCVILHGGLQSGQVAINVNLLDIGCDKSAVTDPAKQAAVKAQLNTGVAHFILQDDTNILAAEMVINEGPAKIECGASTSPVNPATGKTPSGGTNPGTTVAGGSGPVPGTTLPTPPFGSPEPPPVSNMTILAGQRTVMAGELVWVPIWIINGANVANINFEVHFDEAVANDEGPAKRGTYLADSLGQANQNEPNVVLVGHAQTTGQSGTGVITWLSFRATGRPGDKTPLHLVVTTINDPSGTVLSIDRVDGLIQIAGPDGLIPGDCNGDGRLEAVDALCALQMSVRTRPSALSLDLDTDGQVTSRDSTVILQRALGK